MANKDEGTLIVAKRKEVRTFVEQWRGEIAKAIPRGGMTPDRLMRVVFNACGKVPQLWLCTQASLIGAILTSAQLGLECDGTLGRAYLIPRKIKGVLEAQFQIGYQGLKELALRSGKIARVETRIVRAGETFKAIEGTDPKIIHEPMLVPTMPAKLDKAARESWKRFHGPEVIAVYAVAWLKDDDRAQHEVMSAADVEFVRCRATSKNSDAWRDHWPPMARKTVLIRLAKLLSLEAEDGARLNQAVNLDEMAELGIRQNLLLEGGATDEMIEQANATVTGSQSPPPPADDDKTKKPAKPRKPAASKEDPKKPEGRMEVCAGCKTPKPFGDLKAEETESGPRYWCDFCDLEREQPAPTGGQDRGQEGLFDGAAPAE